MKAAKWKLLTLGLAAVVGVLVLVPPVGAAVRSTPDLLNQILTDVGAIKAKTDNLPADPAAKSDVTAAQSALSSQIGALPTSGALRRTIVDANGCVVVSGPIAAGRERSLTISALATAIDAQAEVEVDNTLSPLIAYVMSLNRGVPNTFVESQTAGEILKFCNLTPASTVVMSAIWTEGPAS